MIPSSNRVNIRRRDRENSRESLFLVVYERLQNGIGAQKTIFGAVARLRMLNFRCNRSTRSPTEVESAYRHDCSRLGTCPASLRKEDCCRLRSTFLARILGDRSIRRFLPDGMPSIVRRNRCRERELRGRKYRRQFSGRRVTGRLQVRRKG